MLVQLKEGKIVQECLSNAKKLIAVDDWKKVDRDKQERLRNKKLHEQSWRCRKDGEENLIIYKGKIVDKKKPAEETNVKLGLQD